MDYKFGRLAYWRGDPFDPEETLEWRQGWEDASYDDEQEAP
jgi:hypothetical protein